MESLDPPLYLPPIGARTESRMDKPLGSLVRRLSIWLLVGVITMPPRVSPATARRTVRSMDLDGDGLSDIAVGDLSAQRVEVYPGRPTDLGTTPATVLRAPAPGMFGWDVVHVGDVDGDGYGDLGVSAPARGKVYVFHGGRQGVGGMPWTTLDAPAGVRSYGVDVSAAGDLDADGYADVIVGTGADRAYVYRGGRYGLGHTPTAVLQGPAGSEAGASVAGLGDINGDGYDDVAIGARRTGEVSIRLGGPTGLRPGDIVRTSTIDGFGTSVAAVGDLDGDGRADLAVTALHGAIVVVFRGRYDGVEPVPWVTLTVGDTEVPAGPVAGVGDVDGDGRADLAVAGESMGHRAVLVFRGATVTLGPGPTWVLDAPCGRSPHAIAGVGDVNGDGYDDLAVGNEEGAWVRVYHGGALGPGPTPEETLGGEPHEGGDGWAVAGR